MSAEGIKPMASLGSALLGRRAALRRSPLIFAPIEELTVNSPIDADVPEVVLQVARLAQALGIDAPAEGGDAQDETAGTGRARVAFTVRLDLARHGRLRQLAALQHRSAQQVLVEAFDRYCAGTPGDAALSATKPSPSKAPTGNQP